LTRYSHLPDEVLEALPGLSHVAVRLAVALGAHVNGEGEAWPRRARLMRAAGIKSTASFAKGIAELVAKGLLIVEARGRKASIYRWSSGSKTEPDTGLLVQKMNRTGSKNEPAPVQKMNAPQEHAHENMPMEHEEGAFASCGGRRTAAKADSPQTVVDTWNELAAAHGLPRALKITASRRKAIKTRLSDPDWRASWREALAAIPSSPFLIGQNDRGWRANLDWFLRPDSVVRILEDRYSGTPGGRRRDPTNPAPPPGKYEHLLPKQR